MGRTPKKRRTPSLLERAAAVRWSRFIRGEPSVKQHAFLCEVVSQKLEVFYGGAGGGGKSWALLAGALQYVDVPGYAAIIVRKTYAALSKPEALMDVARQWLAGRGPKWNPETKTWSFPESGATLSFGYLDSERDLEQYQSAAYQYIAFDELTQFPERHYQFLFSRLRRKEGSTVPLRSRSASNPGGPGHLWVKGRFVDPTTRNPDTLFVRAALGDNPHIDRAGYLASLSRLDPITRRQILEGDWTAAREGAIFKRSKIRVLEEAPGTIRRIVRAWDLAADPEGHKTVGIKLADALGPSGRYWPVLHVVSGRWSPGERDEIIRATAEADGRAVTVLVEQEPGSGGIAQVQAIQRALAGFRVEAVRPTGDKVVRAGPVATQMELGRVPVLAGPWTHGFLDALEAFPHDGEDEVDPLAHAFNWLVPAGAQMPGDPPGQSTEDPEDESGRPRGRTRLGLDVPRPTRLFGGD